MYLLFSTCRGVMQDRTVTFYIPDLFVPAKSIPGLDRELALDELALLLSRANHKRSRTASYDEGLFGLFGGCGVSGAFPVAPITRLIDCEERDNSYWLRADPVHLQPNRDQVVMLGNSMLNIRNEEVQLIRDEFNGLFVEDGLYLETPVNHRWYLRCEKTPQICTTPLERVVGKNIDTYLPKGGEALYWHKLLSEAQMLFYGSSVNQRRREEGCPEINSVWMWGGGYLPEAQPVSWRTVWGNDVLSRGLALLHDVEQATLPESLDEWLELATEGEHLIAFDGAHSAIKEQNILAWKAFVESLESDWVGPAIQALKTGELSQINLVTDGGSYELTAKRLKRWWRKRRPFTVHA
ncbi:hypothetical protein ACFL2V_00645 [Pseudomonadota bacterium]